MKPYSEVKGFRGHRINLDTAIELLKPNEAIDCRNMLEEHSSGKLVNMRGFDSVMNMQINMDFSLPPGDFKCVCTDNDIKSGSIDYMLCDTVGTNHSIMRMNVDSKQLIWIFRSEPLLNFQPNIRFNADTIEGMKYWTDGYFKSFENNDFNPPRKINIDKAIKYTQAHDSAERIDFFKVKRSLNMVGTSGYYYTAYFLHTTCTASVGDELVAWAMNGIFRDKQMSGYGKIVSITDMGAFTILTTDRPWIPDTVTEIIKNGYLLPYSADSYYGVDWNVLDVVKSPPIFYPGISYDDDPQQRSNNLRGYLFQFRSRWIYDDNEKSVFSPISNVAFPKKIEVANRITDDDSTSDNVINVWMDSGPMEVKKIELSVRNGAVGNWISVFTKEKYDQDGNCLLTSDINFLYRFYNNEVGMALDQSDVNRPYDFVPFCAKGQEIIEKNRLLYPAYLEGLNNVKLDVSLSIIQEKITNTNATTQSFGVVEIDGNWPWVAIKFPTTINPISTYEIALWIFTEEAGGNSNPGFGNTTGSNLFVYSLVAGPQETVHQLILRFVDLLNVSIPYPLAPGDHWACDGSNVHTGRDMTTIYIKAFDKIFPMYDEVSHDVNQGILAGYDPMLSRVSFKSGARHFFGIDYLAHANRGGATNISDKTSIYIPFLPDTFGNSSYPDKTPMHATRIKWEINHQPPMFATHYRWMYGLSNISYYLQLNVRAGNIIEFGDHSYLSYNESIKNSHDALFNFNIPPYEYVKGDRMRILSSEKVGGYEYFNVLVDKEILGTTFLTYDPVTQTIANNDNAFYKVDKSLSGGTGGAFIMDSNGNKIPDEGTQKIVVSKIDKAAHGIPTGYTGADASSNVIIEIYRPRKNNLDKDLSVYYGIDKIRPVLNPHTSLRSHSGDTDQSFPGKPASGIFTFGDSFIKYRITDGAVYGCEAKQSSDFYDSELPGLGGINVVNANMTNQWLESNMRYSGRLVQNTRVNELSKFIGSDYVELPNKFGGINHIEEVGYTLKILQDRKQSSLYVGRAGVTQPSANGREILTSTNDVLGTLVVHESDFGTVHPGSVYKFEKRYWFFDYYAHAICRDAGNGIENISEAFSVNKRMEEKCLLFGSADNVDVVASYDQSNEIIFFSFTDKTNRQNSFTMAFRDSNGRADDGFIGFFDFIPDNYGTAKKTLTSFSGNDLWLHNSPTAPRANFYGKQYKYWVTVVTNKIPDSVKRFLQIILGTDKVLASPNAGDIHIPDTGNSPGGKISLLKPGSFTSVKGKFVADFGKNMVTNQSTPSITDLVNGDDMEGQAMTVRLEGSETTEHKIISVEIIGVIS